MALHLIPDDGAPHSPTSECGCQPQRTVGRRPGGTHGAVYHHADQADAAAPRRAGGPDHAATGQEC